MPTIIAEPPAYPLVPEAASASSSSQDLHDLRHSSSTPPPAYTERRSRKLRITAAPGAGILNAAILDASGRALYTTFSDAKLKKTTVRRAAVPRYTPSRTRTLVGSGPRRVGPLEPARAISRERRRDGPAEKEQEAQTQVQGVAPSRRCDTESRVLTVHGTRYTITERKNANGCLFGFKDDADASPLLPLARWRTMPDARLQQLEVFDEAYATPGLLDALILALVVMQSGQPLGDVPDCLNMATPMFMGTDLAFCVSFVD
ncbi:hypothetical protein EI94DRAFT_1748714 [Lactarius quietus]|nr:hypothetical protein EI94DRAFT_1748714 [Lactarius quietus]